LKAVIEEICWEETQHNRFSRILWISSVEVNSTEIHSIYFQYVDLFSFVDISYTSIILDNASIQSHKF
jgi:hypothetical protein